MVKPTPKDVICDPAAGTAGFLVSAEQYLRQNHPEILSDPDLRQHYNKGLFNGFEFDATMLRIGAMNMILHGVENPNITYRDSLSEDHAEDKGLTLASTS